MKNLVLCISIILCTLCFSCQKGKRKIKIGVSQCTLNDQWRKSMNDEMLREVGFCQEYQIELIVTDAKNSNIKQAADIQHLVGLKVDVLIVSPNEAAPLTSIISNIHKKGTPVILIDRLINSTNYTCFIAADNFAIGTMAGVYCCHAGHHFKHILELTGLKGSTPAIERSKGFHIAVQKSDTNVKYKVLDGHWMEEVAYAKTDSILKTLYNPDIIYAHNDAMAKGARKACRLNNINPFILGIDGLPVDGNGLDMVINSTTNVSFLYPTGGDIAIQTAIKIYEKQNIRKKICLNSYCIDNRNALSLKIQYQVLLEQQNKIDKQRAHISNMMLLIEKQKDFIRYICAFFVVMVCLLLLILKLNKNKNRANLKISAQKNIINQQLNDLNQYAEKINVKNSILNQQNEEIKTQNEDIAHKNNQIQIQNEYILSGIRCAEALQNFLVNNEKDLKARYDCFILYKPKDIVSGDFFWFKRLNFEDDQIDLILLADCTGHGVAGAMMTILGIKMITQIIEHDKRYEPCEILDELEKKVQMISNDQINTLGMDITICTVTVKKYQNRSMYQIKAASAKNPLYISSNGTIEKISGSKKSIGIHHRSQIKKKFDQNMRSLPSGSILYLTTDGYFDQNNPARQRFGSQNLQILLTKIAHEPLSDQHQILETSLMDFKEKEEQRDDISIIGIKLP